MAFTPISETDKKLINEIFQKKGFRQDLNVESYFRCSISDDNVITITIKKPITFPVRLNIPFEIVSFQFSLNLMIRVIDSSTFENLTYLIDKLREIGIESDLEHEFPVKGREKNLINVLSGVIPEPIKNETEHKWINRIRISILNKQSKFNEFNKIVCTNVNNSIRDLGLVATDVLPWDLKKGIPQYRINNVLFFNNVDSKDEYFILEKGFLTYFKDILVKNIHIRSQWASYTPYVLLELYKDENFDLELLITSWIKFSRLILNSIINLIESESVAKLNFQSFNFQNKIINSGEELTFPLIPLNYESKVAKKLFPIKYKLLHNPPSNFEEIESLELYNQALEKFKNYKFSDAVKLFYESMKNFNKFRQRKIVVLILLHLSNIAQIFKQFDKAIEYLDNGLDLCKEGGIPISLIIKLHKKLGKNFFKIKRYNSAISHYNIIISFLEENQEELTNREILADTYLNLAKIQLKQDNLADAKLLFNKALSTAKGSLNIQLKYYYERAKYNREKEKISHAIKLCKQAFGILGDDEKTDRKYKKRILRIEKLLVKIFIYDRKDAKSAQIIFNDMKRLVSKDSIFNLKMTLRYFQLQADLHKFLLKDDSLAKYFVDQAQNVKMQLKVIGVPV